MSSASYSTSFYFCNRSAEISTSVIPLFLLLFLSLHLSSSSSKFSPPFSKHLYLFNFDLCLSHTSAKLGIDNDSGAAAAAAGRRKRDRKRFPVKHTAVANQRTRQLSQVMKTYYVACSMFTEGECRFEIWLPMVASQSVYK